MLRFSGEISGVDVLDRAFNRIEQYISDFRSVWPAVAKIFYEIEREQFDTQGSAGQSGRWSALSPAYKKWKEVHFPGEPILQATHALVDSMTSPDANDSIFRVDPMMLTIGTQREGARAHQRTRPIISLREDQKRRLQKAIQSGLVQFTRNLGFQVEDKAA
jgi:phage gpG-like protein